MRPGGSSFKGAEFERHTGCLLSVWISRGARSDLFSRNVLSGGRFTNASKRGKTNLIPGDLMPSDPLAFEFAKNFFVECKHVSNAGLSEFMLEPPGKRKTFLAKVIDLAALQAEQSGRRYMVIVRQNRWPILIFVSNKVGDTIRKTAKPQKALHFHMLHQNTIMMLKFDDFLSLCRADMFLAGLAPIERELMAV